MTQGRLLSREREIRKSMRERERELFRMDGRFGKCKGRNKNAETQEIGKERNIRRRADLGIDKKLGTVEFGNDGNQSAWKRGD